MKVLMDWLFKQPRTTKRIMSLALDAVFIFIAFWSSFALRLDSFELFNSGLHWQLLFFTLPITLLSFVKFGLYRAILRYMPPQALMAIIYGVFISAIAMSMIAYQLDVFMPRSVPVIYMSLAFIFCSRSRGVARNLYHHAINKNKIPVIVYGAGSAGRQLSSMLQIGSEYKVVAFLDDNQSLHGIILQGIKVYSPENLMRLVQHYRVRQVLLAMPSISRQHRREITERLKHFPINVLSVPGSADIISGKAKITELNEVNIEDLLGRDPVAPFSELFQKNIKDKVVMVTGAGGSIGSELCRQIVSQKPLLLILFEISEYALYQIEQELKVICHNNACCTRIIPIIASVQQQGRLESVMSTFNVQTVYHAAAYKHVPMVEYNVIEGIYNNVFGTFYAATAASKCGVETFVLISTDKAVRPTNIMGASKRLAELILQGMAKRQNKTLFCMVRFGNVLGSSGSVVPLFRKQIRSGGPLTLTHPEITRYFMTIPEAAQLVIQAGAMAKGGDVFVLDMGEPIKILELAHRMIHLMGYKVKNGQHPDGDIEIQTTGLRPGEKLYEELLIGDNEQPTLHPRIKTANEVDMPWLEMAHFLEQLRLACEGFDLVAVRNLLLRAPTAFNPQDDICDLVWIEKSQKRKS